MEASWLSFLQYSVWITHTHTHLVYVESLMTEARADANTVVKPIKWLPWLHSSNEHSTRCRRAVCVAVVVPLMCFGLYFTGEAEWREIHFLWNQSLWRFVWRRAWTANTVAGSDWINHPAEEAGGRFTGRKGADAASSSCKDVTSLIDVQVDSAPPVWADDYE